MALAVAKKVWARNKRFESIEVMHLDSENDFDSILKLGKQTQDENSRAILENPNIDKRIDFFTFDDDDVSSSSSYSSTRNVKHMYTSG